jgi:hypothetical protein
MPKRRKLCLATIIAESVAPDHKRKTSPAYQWPPWSTDSSSIARKTSEVQRDGRAPLALRQLHLHMDSEAQKIDATAYATQMMRIEEQRNAACRQGDAVTLRMLTERHASLNHRFWGRSMN